MKRATEDTDELKACMAAFEAREMRLYGLGVCRPKKRRKRMLDPSEGRYTDPLVNERWMAWQGCWDYLKS